MSLALLTFTIAGSRYAVPLEVVSEVVGVSADDVRDGSWRADDQELPVLDGREIVGVGQEPSQSTKRGVVVEIAGQELVLLVDVVIGVKEYDPSALAATPTYFTSRTEALVRGIVEDGPELTIVLRPEEIPLPVAKGEAESA
jgi:chemotaxis signal transduction protein